jgi:hypothetical protein
VCQEYHLLFNSITNSKKQKNSKGTNSYSRLSSFLVSLTYICIYIYIYIYMPKVQSYIVSRSGVESLKDSSLAVRFH